jgi:hypothetical protein
MQLFFKRTGLVLALALLSGSAFAVVAPTETVTVQGMREGLTADLDPTKDHPDGFTAEQIDRDINPADRYSAFREFSKGLTGPLNDFYDWQGVYESGSFIPTHEFRESGLLCRDFTEQTRHQGSEGYDPMSLYNFDDRPLVVFGTACRERDGWHFR